MITAYIALGANVGGRRRTIKQAIQQLNQSPAIRVTQLSTIIETEPIGYLTQPGFMNAVAEIQTSLSPDELLYVLKLIESRLGRVETVRWGPRLIDLDILLFGNEVIRTVNLSIPHPQLHHRRFLLALLMEIAPLCWHPVQQKAIYEMCES